MKKINFAVLTLLFFFGTLPETLAQTPTPAPPPVQETCNAQSGGGQSWKYCIYKSQVSTSADVLYYFHGLEGNENEWRNSPVYANIYALWGSAAPIVVSISYGTVWLLAEKNAAPVSGLYENFLSTAMPSIETAEKLTPAHRLLLGLSMGGFNAAQLYLKTPSLFSKVGLACPALTPIGPFSNVPDVLAYIVRTQATASYVAKALAISKVYFPTPEDWGKSDAVSLANTDISPTSPPLYVSGGLQDEYGFFDGAQTFVSRATAHGAVATWVPLQGKHCTYDWEGTARFFIAQ